MSTLRDPVGPKDRKVYIRRRIIVLVGLLAVVLAVVLVIVRPGSTGGAKDAEKVEVPNDIPADADSDDEKTDDDDAPVCDAGQIEVTPVTDKSSYAEGELPKFSLKIENTGSKACSADLGTAGMKFEVTSGDDLVWSSADCQEDPESLPVILDPEKALETDSVEWDRTRSSTDTCDVSRESVVGGGASYHLTAEAGGTKSGETAQFVLN